MLAVCVEELIPISGDGMSFNAVMGGIEIAKGCSME